MDPTLQPPDPGVSKPLETVSSDDLGGLIAILAAFSLGLIVTAFGIRWYARAKIKAYKVDDLLFLAAAFFAAVQATCVFFGLRIGLGRVDKLLVPQLIELLEKTVFSGDLLYIFTLLLSKLSTAFLLLRLTPGRGHFYALWATIAFSIAWSIVSILLLTVSCHSHHPWTDVFSSAECPSIITKWEVITVFDSLTEISLFSISIYLVWGLKMPLKSKAIVVSAFGCRLPVIIPASLRLYYLQVALTSTNGNFHMSYAIICEQLQIGYSISASMMPCLKTFMAAYEPKDTASQYNNYKLSPMGSKNTSNSQSQPNSQNFDEESGHRKSSATRKFDGKLRPDLSIYEARVTGEERGKGKGFGSSRSLESGDSRRMFIKKGVEWSVDWANNEEEVVAASDGGISHTMVI